VQKGAAEQTGARVMIAAGPTELARAPSSAVRYDSQTFRFPSGEIRVLKFRKSSGGVLHQITTETQLYVATGSASVDVAGVRTELAAGDVVNLPSGIVRNAASGAEDTTLVLHTVASARRARKPRSCVASNPEAVIESGGKSRCRWRSRRGPTLCVRR
jgi:quercetin dioxygenase-like cupin family protein